MANTITKQTIQDSERNLIVKVQISGDNSGDETATQLIDMSSYTSSVDGRAPASLRIDRVMAGLQDFSCQLLWDATTDVKILDIPPLESVDYDYGRFGGLINNAGTGVTGDIMLTTSGLGTEEGYILLEMTKKY